jgi:UDP-galactose transporter B1
MARSKQVTPIRREPSSEYFSKQDRPVKDLRACSADVANGKAEGIVSVAPATKREAGFVTLVMDVAGIYASL